MICLVDERISEKCECALIKRGFKPIKLPRCLGLDLPISSHPDILLFYHNGNIITSADYCERYPYVFSDIREFSDARLIFTDEVQEKTYPFDAIFNALIVGNRIFLKKDTASNAILNYAKESGLEIVPTKQGYPACTTLAFGNSAITGDEGMARLLEGIGINVTLISNGDILLPPYKYGFIGGTAGVIGNTIYFLGDLSRHRDFQRITEALEREGFSACSLSDEPLSDLGRIIFID